MNPSELHPDSLKLIQDFSQALTEKMLLAQRKYGHSNIWRNNQWLDQCRQDLMRHLHKGDPRDVAIYCAFLWYHNTHTVGFPLTEPTFEKYACTTGYVSVHLVSERNLAAPKTLYSYGPISQEEWEQRNKPTGEK